LRGVDSYTGLFVEQAGIVAVRWVRPTGGAKMKAGGRGIYAENTKGFCMKQKAMILKLRDVLCATAIVTALVLGFGQTVGAAEVQSSLTWYVDEKGKDTNAGTTAATPLATVAKALELIRNAYNWGEGWPTTNDGPAHASIVIAGTITQNDPLADALIDIRIEDAYPPIDLLGNKARPGVLNANKQGRVLYISDENNVTLGANLTLTGAADSGVMVESANFTMTGGTISGNIAVYGGGASVFGTFTMTDGTISGNIAEHGGGVSVYGTLIMTGGTISGNTAEGEPGDDGAGGGGVIINTGEFTVTGGTISNNNAVYCGGGVSLWFMGCTFEMEGGVISGNKVTRAYDDMFGFSGGNGGGVYVCAGMYPSTFAMNGGTISRNIAEGSGGGVYGTLFIESGTISGNTAYTSGGGVAVDYDGDFTKTGGIIYGYTQGNQNSNVVKEGNKVLAGNGHAISFPYIGYDDDRNRSLFLEKALEKTISENRQIEAFYDWDIASHVYTGNWTE
jgi:hypothetical protein